MEVTVTCSETVGFFLHRLARIKPVMQSYMDEHGYSGISAMLTRQGQMVHFELVGWHDRENQVSLS